MARKRLTENQQAYRKEITRIKSFVRSAEKRGYIFPEFKVPTMPKRVTKKSLEEIKSYAYKPAAIYAKYGYKLDRSTGEVIPAYEARQHERRVAAAKAQVTKVKNKLSAQYQPEERPDYEREYDYDIDYDFEDEYTGEDSPDNLSTDNTSVLANVEEIIQRWQPMETWSTRYVELKELHKNMLSQKLEEAIATYGRAEVARRMEESAVDAGELAESICYSDSKGDELRSDINAFVSIIVGRPLTSAESLDLQDEIDANEMI